jgi:hypothetical protein
MKTSILALVAILLAGLASAHAQTGRKLIPVTPDKFVRAETDMHFGYNAKLGAMGKFHHYRELAPIDKQIAVRLSRDLLPSLAVFDLDAGPVTITLPDPGKRFTSMTVIDENHYIRAVAYGAGKHTFTRKKIGTRYLLAVVRTFFDPMDPKDFQRVHALQNAMKVSQKYPGKFEVPDWDPVSQKKVRDALLALGETMGDSKRMFGSRKQTERVRHLVGSAIGWGGNNEKDATHLPITPSRNDGATVHKVSVKRVPVDAFWSISVYNAQGYFEKNSFDAYNVNNVTAKKGAGGSVTVQFGGCDGKIPNCLPIMKGWNYSVRFYRPRAEILHGKWKFPEAQPVPHSDVQHEAIAPAPRLSARNAAGSP